MNNKEKVAKLQKKSVQNCKAAWKMETNPQSVKKKRKKKLQSGRKNQYKTAKLHGKWRQILKV